MVNINQEYENYYGAEMPELDYEVEPIGIDEAARILANIRADALRAVLPGREDFRVDVIPEPFPFEFFGDVAQAQGPALFDEPEEDPEWLPAQRVPIYSVRNQVETVADLYERAERQDEPVIPFLHRSIGVVLRCSVEGCEIETSNDCGICIRCHPIYPFGEFPCSIRR
jgi:hypothetical protein